MSRSGQRRAPQSEPALSAARVQAGHNRALGLRAAYLMMHRRANAVFAQVGLTADQFVRNTTGLAADGNDHIIYETDTGWLYYDSNGSAAGGSTHFATLAANLALTNADFIVL